MRALLDACVLYPTVMRELLLGCAAAGLYEPRWSARILEEWARAAARRGPADEAVARGEIALLRAAWPAAEVRGWEWVAGRLWLPDADDVHVLAAAVAGSADVVVTLNASDFPRNILAEEGLSRADPDAFLLGFLQGAPQVLRAVVDEVVARATAISGNPWTADRLLAKARLYRLRKALLAGDQTGG